MGPLAWGLLVLVLYPLLQVPVILYVSRYVEFDDDRPRPPVHRSPTESAESAHPRSFDGQASRSEESAVVCHRCGTENASGYTYCRNCVARLNPGGL